MKTEEEKIADKFLELGSEIERLRSENALLKREAREAIEILGGYSDED